jgi:aspartyl-tRNA(Asn)/glutamyl-tRNA(Gln) amidotransferase subunit C
MAIDIDIAYVARLARIELSGDELAHYGGQLEGILEHAALVQQLPTDDVEPTSHPLPMVNALRPDVVTPPLDRATALSQAPQAENGYFRVPPTLEEE